MLLTVLSLLFSGLAQAAISPPLNWIVLHPVSWVPAMAVFSRLEGRRALLAGWAVGIAAELAIFCWLPGTVSRFGNLPVPVGVMVWLLFAVLTGFYTAVFAWGFSRLRRLGGRRWPFVIAVWFCALEFLNPQLFGYLQGVAWYQVPHVFLVSAVTGVSGVSFLVMLCNGVALQGFELVRGHAGVSSRAWITNVAGLALLVAAAMAVSSARRGEIDAAEREAKPLRLAIIQPNHTIPRREAMLKERSDVFARDLVSLSRDALASSPGRIDAFVWPEGALRADPGQRRNVSVLEFARETGSEVWTGANHYEREGARNTASHNSAFRILADGRLDTRYDKNVLVPFGEYVPFKDVVPLLARIDTVGDFDAGTTVPRYDHQGARFVFLICYEAIRSGFVREATRDDVNLVVNVTTDAWYGLLSEQSQHLMLVATQAAMNGLPVVRSTTTGTSAFIDARGMITASTGTFTRETLVREVRPVRVASVVSRWGDWFAWSCVAASAALLAASRRREGPAPTEGPRGGS
jgi:apolipoprotein N-acyltransferase